MKNKGLHQRRFFDNPLEQKFAEAWEKEADHILPFVLPENLNHCNDARSRDREVAATIIQWLGSPVGQGFLRDVQGEFSLGRFLAKV
jgi:hypothetical protein